MTVTCTAQMKAKHEAMTKGVMELEAVLRKLIPPNSLEDHRNVFSVAPRLHALQVCQAMYIHFANELCTRLTVCHVFLQSAKVYCCSRLITTCTQTCGILKTEQDARLFCKIKSLNGSKRMFSTLIQKNSWHLKQRMTRM